MSCVASNDEATRALCAGGARPVAMCLPRCKQPCEDGMSCIAGVCTPPLGAKVLLTVDPEVRHQTLVGFGASLAYAEGAIVARTDKAALYDLMFAESGFDMLRLTNQYDAARPNVVQQAGEIVAAASQRMGRTPTLFMTSGTPPPDLKANGSRTCAGDPATCTLVAVEVMRQFHGELLHFDHFAALSKVGVADYTESINAELEEASYLFFDRVFSEGYGLHEVFTSTRGFLGPRMAELYGVTPPLDGFAEHDLGAARAGYFTQLPFLMLYAHNDGPDAIHRGVVMSLDVLCAPLGPPAAVITLQWGDGTDGTKYDVPSNRGLGWTFHQLSHRIQSDSASGNNPTAEAAHHEIDTLRMESLLVGLDAFAAHGLEHNTQLVWTNTLSDGPSHSTRGVSMIVWGSGGGYLKQGTYIDAAGTQNARVLNTLMAAATRDGSGPAPMIGSGTFDPMSA